MNTFSFQIYFAQNEYVSIHALHAQFTSFIFIEIVFVLCNRP